MLNVVLYLGFESDIISLCENLCDNKALKKLYIGQNFSKGRWVYITSYRDKFELSSQSSPCNHYCIITTTIVTDYYLVITAFLTGSFYHNPMATTIITNNYLVITAFLTGSFYHNPMATTIITNNYLVITAFLTGSFYHNPHSNHHHH